MSQKTPAREKFLLTTYAYRSRTVENWEAVITLAKRIYEAESAGFRIDPDSVERALKRALGVEQV